MRKQLHTTNLEGYNFYWHCCHAHAAAFVFPNACQHIHKFAALSAGPFMFPLKQCSPGQVKRLLRKRHIAWMSFERVWVGEHSACAGLHTSLELILCVRTQARSCLCAKTVGLCDCMSAGLRWQCPIAHRAARHKQCKKQSVPGKHAMKGGRS